MRPSSVFRCLFLFSLAIPVWAQAPKTEPDVVIFNDGERLSGHLVSATSTNFTFQSDALGSITADWSKVKELHSSKSFAVIPKGVEFKRNADTSAIPEGTLAVADQKITVSPAAGEPKIVSVSDATNVVDAGAFEQALKHNGGFFQDWTGGVSGGALFRAGYAGCTHFQRRREPGAYRTAGKLAAPAQPHPNQLHHHLRSGEAAGPPPL